MFELLRNAKSRQLALDEYLSEFFEVLNETSDRFDKLERAQTFQEPGYDSWEAFARGDWSTSLALIEGSRPALVPYYEGMAERGLTARRVRAAALPITPYLQWEMQVLRLRAELGESIRVLDAAALDTAEQDGPLPEIVIIGKSRLYEVVYSEAGVAEGARAYSDTTVIESCAEALATLYERGEDLFAFFEREIAPLPPPL